MAIVLKINSEKFLKNTEILFCDEKFSYIFLY